MNITESFLQYLQLEKNYSLCTVRSYGIDLAKFEDFFRAVDDSLSYAEMDADVVRLWIAQMMDEGYTATTVNRKLSTLRSFYKYMLSNGLTTVNPLSKVKGPKNRKPLPTFLKEGEMNKLLDDVVFDDDFSGVRDRTVLMLFYETGLRLAELVGLTDVDVDLSSSLIKVTGKRNKQRLIPFGNELYNALVTYIKVRDAQFPVKGNAFFLSNKGENISRAQVYALVRNQLSKVVSLKKRSPHVLRHTFATSMLNNQAELGAVKELLGHSNLATTEVYTHTTFEELKRIYKLAHPRA